MLPEHYIMGVYIETKNGGQLHRFQPGDTPKATFTLADGDEFVAAYEYCNFMDYGSPNNHSNTILYES